MSEVRIDRRSVFLPKSEKAWASKKKALEFFECDPHPEKDLGRGPCVLADLTSCSAKQAATLGKRLQSAETILVQPGQAAAGIPGIPSEKLVEFRPLRGWAMASKMREFRLASSAGDLCSLRLFWEWPRKMAGSPKAFRETLLPDLLDLAEHMAGAQLRALKIEPIGGGNAAFVAALLEGNIVVEMNVNETLPDSLAPVRLVHAYFTKGALGNMPLYGYENDEGMLVADDRGSRREICEHVSWDGKNEWEDFYLRMVGSILDGTFGEARAGRQALYLDAIERAWKAPGQVAVGQNVGGRP
jgi:hypothetical protein